MSLLDVLLALEIAATVFGLLCVWLEELTLQASSRDDVIFLCGDDIPYDDSWDRSGEMNREWMQEQIRKDLAERGDNFVELLGSVDQRAARVKEVLSRSADP